MDFRLAAEMDKGIERYIVGITPSTDTVLKKYGFFESLYRGVAEAARMTVEITILFFGFLFKLITGKIALATAGKTVAGPILIAKVSGDVAQSGISNLLQFHLAYKHKSRVNKPSPHTDARRGDTCFIWALRR